MKGSLVGFGLYFCLLKHLEPTRVAFVPLVTPVSTLLLGHQLNGEALTAEVWMGTGLIIWGLLLFELVGRPVSTQARLSKSG